MPQAIFLLILKLKNLFLHAFCDFYKSSGHVQFPIFSGFPGRVQTLEGMLRAKDEVQLVYVMF